MRLHIILVGIFILVGIHLKAQTITSTSNVMPANGTTGTLYIGSGTLTTPINKASIGGSLKLFNTGTNGVSSPSLYLWNTTATTGRNYYLNTDNLGNFRIIDSNASNAVRFHISGLASTLGFIGIGNTAPAGRLHITGTGSTNATTSFLVQNSANAEMLRVLNNGNVGIGTATPANKLSIAGATASNFGLHFPGLTNATTTTINSGKALALDASGNVVWANITAGSGWSLTGNAGTASTNFIGTTDAQPLRFKVNTAVDATDRLYIAPNGNIGINTTSPATKLSINSAVPGISGLQLGQLNTGTPASLSTGKVLNVDFNGMVVLESLGTLGLKNNINNSDWSGVALAPANGGTGLTSLGTVSQQLRVNSAGTALEYFTPVPGGSSQWTTSASHIYYNAGNVGIGTTTPAYNLDVNGTASFGGAKKLIVTNNAWNGNIAFEATDLLFFKPATGMVVFEGGNGTSFGGDLQISNKQGVASVRNIIRGFNYQSGVTNQELFICTSGFGNQNIGENVNAGDIRLAAGINSADLASLNGKSYNIVLQPTATGNVKVTTLNGTGNVVMYVDANGNLKRSTIDISSVGSSGSSNWTASGNNIFNGNTGLVVIGALPTTLPIDASLKLAVNGNIYAKKLKITQTGWADYVFDASYQLPALKEVEQYIQKHKHLPDVPSAAEVQKNGIDVGDNQAVLLRKIEELTLYMIEQNKRMEAQQKEIDELKKKVGGKQ